MLLADFVAETIRQIASGVHKAQESAKEHGMSVNPINSEASLVPRLTGYTREIEFDVAVTTTEGRETKGGVGVFVGAVTLGSQGKSDASSTSVNRIKFSVPVLFPTLDIADKSLS